MNFELARQNMIEQQIRPWDVLDVRVLDVLGEVHRENFVPPRYRRLAFADTTLPLGSGEVMMKPNVEARMLQALDVNPGDSVLEVGTGSGYVTACLNAMGGEVTSVELREDLLREAERRLGDSGREADLLHTDVFEWSPQQRYRAIAVTGAVADDPERFGGWLEVGGRLFAIVGAEPAMEAVLITRVAEDQWTSESLFETVLPYLVGAQKPKPFVL